MTSSSSGSISSSFQCSGNLPLAQLRKCFQSEDRWFIQILLKFFPTCGEIFGTAKVISVTLVWKKTLRYYTARFWEQTNHHPEIQMIILIFVFHFCKKTEKKKKITPNFSRQTYHGMEATVEANRCNSINQATTAGASAVATAVFSASGTMVLANILFASRSAGGFTISKPLVVMEKQRWCSLEMRALHGTFYRSKLSDWHSITCMVVSCSHLLIFNFHQHIVLAV